MGMMKKFLHTSTEPYTKGSEEGGERGRGGRQVREAGEGGRGGRQGREAGEGGRGGRR